MQKCDFRKVANQLYWNTLPHGCFSVNLLHICRTASCFDEHLWGTRSVNFYSTCLPYFSVQIRVKFRLFSNMFLTRSMFSSEREVLRLPELYLFLFRVAPCGRYFLTFCWIVFLQGGAWLNCCRNAAWTAMYLFLPKSFSTTEICSY